MPYGSQMCGWLLLTIEMTIIRVQHPQITNLMFQIPQQYRSSYRPMMGRVGQKTTIPSGLMEWQQLMEGS